MGNIGPNISSCITLIAPVTPVNKVGGNFRVTLLATLLGTSAVAVAP